MDLSVSYVITVGEEYFNTGTIELIETTNLHRCIFANSPRFLMQTMNKRLLMSIALYICLSIYRFNILDANKAHVNCRGSSSVNDDARCSTSLGQIYSDSRKYLDIYHGQKLL